MTISQISGMLYFSEKKDIEKVLKVMEYENIIKRGMFSATGEQLYSYTDADLHFSSNQNTFPVLLSSDRKTVQNSWRYLRDTEMLSRIKNESFFRAVFLEKNNLNIYAFENGVLERFSEDEISVMLGIPKWLFLEAQCKIEEDSSKFMDNDIRLESAIDVAEKAYTIIDEWLRPSEPIGRIGINNPNSLKIGSILPLPVERREPQTVKMRI